MGASTFFDTHAKDEGLFGHVSGHVYPGSAFLVIGIWTLFNLTLRNGSSTIASSAGFTSRTWYHIGCRSTRLPVEPVSKVLLASLGTVIELLSCQFQIYNLDRSSDAVFRMESVNNMSHVAMYGFFFLNGLVEILSHYELISATRYASHFTCGLAYYGVGFLFYFHLDDDRSQIDATAHSVIYSLCFIAGSLLILEARFNRTRELSLLRCFVIVLLGSWFYQVAFALYTQHHWSMTATADAMFLPVTFTWHCFGWIVVFTLALVLHNRRTMNSTMRSTMRRDEDKASLARQSFLSGGEPAATEGLLSEYDAETAGHFNLREL